jgi:hypothetical protein
VSERHGLSLLSKVGLRFNNSVIDPGAQAGRQGNAGPVRLLLGGEGSPVALFFAFAFRQLE